jgi:hypothetical protein
MTTMDSLPGRGRQQPDKSMISEVSHPHCLNVTAAYSTSSIQLSVTTTRAVATCGVAARATATAPRSER